MGEWDGVDTHPWKHDDAPNRDAESRGRPARGEQALQAAQVWLAKHLLGYFFGGAAAHIGR